MTVICKKTSRGVYDYPVSLDTEYHVHEIWETDQETLYKIQSDLGSVIYLPSEIFKIKS